jgi:anti-anti-sigma factor
MELSVMDDEPFSAHQDADTGTLLVSGTIDEESIAEFREALRVATDEYTCPAVVDLTAVTLMPSLAVGVLLGAMARAPGTRVEVEPGTIAHRALEMLGLDEYTREGRAAG